MYEMPTGEFDVISRETHPPSYRPENDIASFERLEMLSSFTCTDITLINMNICTETQFPHVFRLLIIQSIPHSPKDSQ